jgi:hypothetical protein
MPLEELFTINKARTFCHRSTSAGLDKISSTFDVDTNELLRLMVSHPSKITSFGSEDERNAGVDTLLPLALA